MTRVLLISIVYEPDMVSTAAITARLARELHALGHDVAVLSTIPHYNPPEAPATGRRRWFERTDEDGITVVRCYAHRKRRPLSRRALDLTMSHVLLAAATFRFFRDRDVVIVVSPPFTLAVVGFLARALGGGKLVYNAQELWPDVAKDLGFVRNRFLLAAMTGLERFIYRHADHLVPIGPHFARVIVGRGADPERVTTIPNFVDADWIRPGPKDNALSRRLGLAGSPVVLYAGNIGLTQDFDTLLEAAAALEPAGVQFVIVGNGAGRPALEASLADRSLPNVRLESYHPAEHVTDLYALADVVVVPLKEGHDRTTTPSKILSAMAAGRPVVASAAAGTDLAQTVEHARAGTVVPTGDAAALAAAIVDLLPGGSATGWDPDTALAAARAHSPEAVARQYDAIMATLTAHPGAQPAAARPRLLRRRTYAWRRLDAGERGGRSPRRARRSPTRDGAVNLPSPSGGDGEVAGG